MTAVNLTQQLVQIDTTSHKSNLQLIRFAAEYLESLGLRPNIYPNADGSKANLIASIGEGDGGLMLAGHCDVVPVEDQNWSVDPFGGTLVDDKLFGRGACDMKGYLGVMLSVAPKLISQPKDMPVHLAITFDEEVGCFGAKQLISDLAGSGITPRYCVVGEPTSMKIATKHKGKTWLRCSITGSPGHSSSPEKGVNSIDIAAELIMYLEQFR
jgi:acetylornithine deacetylase